MEGILCRKKKHLENISGKIYFFVVGVCQSCFKTMIGCAFYFHSKFSFQFLHVFICHPPKRNSAKSIAIPRTAAQTYPICITRPNCSTLFAYSLFLTSSFFIKHEISPVAL